MREATGPRARGRGARTPLRSGDRYAYPRSVREALERIFGERATDGIEIVYRPWYVRLHGMRRGSTTRPERIYTNLSPDEFFSNELHLLHEHFHVIHQWRCGRLSRLGYLWKRLREGRANAWEREAEEFARGHGGRLRELVRGLV